VKISTRVKTPVPKRPPNVMLSSLSPTVEARAMMKSSAGNAIVISVTRETVVSTQPRK